MTAAALTLTFELSGNGRVRVSERSCKEGGYITTELLSEDNRGTVFDNVDLEVSLNNNTEHSESEPDVVQVELSAHHVKSDLSERVFHAGLTFDLTFADLKRLHSYLGCLLAIGPLESEP